MTHTRLPAILIAVLVATPSAAAVVCRTKAGTVVIRDACRRREKAVNLADFGAVGPPGSSAAHVVFGNSDYPLSTGAGSSAQFAPSGYTHDPSADLSSEAIEQITPATTLVARDLTARFDGPPGAGATRSVTLLVNGVDTLTCTVTGTDSDCDSGDSTAMLSPKSILKIAVRNGPVTTGPSTGVTWSFRMTTP
jgi:hypothetical protein